MLFDYDEKDALSILKYAKQFEGITPNKLIQMLEESPIKYHKSISEFPKKDYDFNEKGKGTIGLIIERCLFGYSPNSKQEADFLEAGTELKTTCIDINKKGEMRAGERLSITNISYGKPEEDFYKSHVWDKIRLILLFHYIRDGSIDRYDQIIKYINLFTPTPNDLKIIIDDYNKINQKIKEGKAHELSEADTMYLGACTKGATADTSYISQYNSDELAKRRNFCLKNSYMNYVLKEYVIKNHVPFKLANEDIYRYSDSKLFDINENDSILNQYNLINQTFEEYVLDLLTKQFGKTDKELCSLYDIPYDMNNKGLWKSIAMRILGIRSNKAEEFEKAGIVVKTIRISKNGKIKESMSFPAFNMIRLAYQKWEESDLYNYLSETKFLFVVYKESDNGYILSKAKFWNMPISLLETTVKDCWLKTKYKIKDGVNFIVKEDKNGKKTIYNDLPGMSDNEVVHVRPHTSLPAYKLNNGYEVGNLKRDADTLPNGEMMTKQSFWLNSSFVLQIINEE